MPDNIALGIFDSLRILRKPMSGQMQRVRQALHVPQNPSLHLANRHTQKQIRTQRRAFGPFLDQSWCAFVVVEIYEE